ncbi:MAG: SynChlorMet cassette radical SAM/SPASM protein ScmE [Syntrophobacterales bacterium]|nr:SynChlorMet cassette radical SAM/SPASM protein ScmE [Syntrophobacterales bacterium]
MKTPRSVDIEITNGCNLRCTYCSHFSAPGDVGRDMPLDDWRRFFSELKRCAVMNVTLSGGEPFYRQDLQAIIASIVENRMRFSILSNGTLIKPEMAAFLAATGRCNSVQVSLDGALDITHDAFRGEGNFVKALGGIRMLQKFNLPVTVRVTIHRKNVHELEAIAALLLEEIGLPSFSTNAASYMGLCRKNTEQTQLTVAERSAAMETLLGLSDKYGNRISATAGPLADARMWAEMKEAGREKKPPMAGRGFLTGCGCPFQSISVRADGAYVPCSQLGHIVLGQINRDDLCDLWQNHPALWNLRNRKLIPLSSFALCQDCPYRDYCTGNCPALSYNLTGKVNSPSPDACLRLFEQQGGCLPECLLNHRPVTAQ